jgi:hypothetical protein
MSPARAIAVLMGTLPGAVQCHLRRCERDILSCVVCNLLEYFLMDVRLPALVARHNSEAA